MNRKTLEEHIAAVLQAMIGKPEKPKSPKDSIYERYLNDPSYVEDPRR